MWFGILIPSPAYLSLFGRNNNSKGIEESLKLNMHVHPVIVMSFTSTIPCQYGAVFSFIVLPSYHSFVPSCKISSFSSSIIAILCICSPNVDHQIICSYDAQINQRVVSSCDTLGMRFRDHQSSTTVDVNS